MKSYSVGRDPSCNIVLYDNTDVVSRRHAIINVAPSGKITITDMSSNGTYVNGIRIASNVPVPVTRKDNVSFAHVAKLDWNQVPRELGWLRYLIGAIAALLLVCIAVLVFRYCDRAKQDSSNGPVPAAIEQTDTTKQDTTKKDNPEAKKEATKGDSTAVKSDSKKKDNGGKSNGNVGKGNGNQGNGGKGNGGQGNGGGQGKGNGSQGNGSGQGKGNGGQGNGGQGNGQGNGAGKPNPPAKDDPYIPK